MNRTILFGGTSSSPWKVTSQSKHKNLIQFRAGKMVLQNKIISADKRMGIFFVYQADDSLMHFCWKDITSGIVEDDLIIFPEDAVFKKVPCTTGRVFVLKFKSSSRRCFYWLQEPKTDRDNEYFCKVNQYLKNPPASGSSRGGTSGSLGGSSTPSGGAWGLQSELSTLGDGDLPNLSNNISQKLLGGVGEMSQMGLSSLLGSSRPSSATAASTTSFASGHVIKFSDLQSILSGLTMSPAAAGAASTVDAKASKPSVDLSSALTALQPLFNNKELIQSLRRQLRSEASASTPAESKHLRTTVQSPQFQQAHLMFGAALQSGHLSSEVVAAANSGDMDAFVTALQKPKESVADVSKDKKAQDKDMVLD